MPPQQPAAPVALNGSHKHQQAASASSVRVDEDGRECTHSSGSDTSPGHSVPTTPPASPALDCRRARGGGGGRSPPRTGTYVPPSRNAERMPPAEAALPRQQHPQPAPPPPTPHPPFVYPVQQPPMPAGMQWPLDQELARQALMLETGAAAEAAAEVRAAAVSTLRKLLPAGIVLEEHGSMRQGTALPSSDADVYVRSEQPHKPLPEPRILLTDLAKRVIAAGVGFVQHKTLAGRVFVERLLYTQPAAAGQSQPQTVQVDVCASVTGDRDDCIRQLLAKGEPEARRFVLWVKEWARSKQVNEAVRSFPNSISWVVLSVHHCQVSGLIPLLGEEDAWTPPAAASKPTMSSLACGFFRWLWNLKRDQVVSLGALPAGAASWTGSELSVVDPADEENNLANATTFEGWGKVRKEVEEWLMSVQRSQMLTQQQLYYQQQQVQYMFWQHMQQLQAAGMAAWDRAPQQPTPPQPQGGESLMDRCVVKTDPVLKDGELVCIGARGDERVAANVPPGLRYGVQFTDSDGDENRFYTTDCATLTYEPMARYSEGTYGKQVVHKLAHDPVSLNLEVRPHESTTAFYMTLTADAKGKVMSMLRALAKRVNLPISQEAIQFDPPDVRRPDAVSPPAPRPAA